MANIAESVLLLIPNGSPLEVAVEVNDQGDDLTLTLHPVSIVKEIGYEEAVRRRIVVINKDTALNIVKPPMPAANVKVKVQQ